MNENPLNPEVPAEPVAPVEPIAPVAQPTESDKTDADEWDAAANDVFPGLKSVNEDKKDESAKSDKADEKTETDKKTETGEESKTDTTKSDEANDANKTEETESVEPTGAIARLSAREQQQEVEAAKTEIRKKMFKDVPTELKDRDGDLIKSIEDVMKLRNPNTGEAFTEEEAGMFLLQAQAKLKENIAEVEKQIDQITETTMDIKDQADVINHDYGKLLDAIPDLKEQLWNEYKNTLIADPKSGIYTKAPVSLEKFYAAALEPYAILGRQLEAQEATTTAATEQATEQAEQTKQQRRQDRSDIYGSGKVDTQTDDDKEWAKAATAVFGPKQ